MTEQGKAVPLELELVLASLAQLHLKVDSLNHYLKLQSRSVNSMITTLRDIMREPSLTPRTVADGDTV